MGVGVYQNPKYPNVRYWRVSRTVNCRVVNKYFPYTPAGKREACAHDKMLRQRHIDTRRQRAKGSITRRDESTVKTFKTGVIGITLNTRESQSQYVERGINTLYFMLLCTDSAGRRRQLTRSIRAHGYADAWRQCCEALWRIRGWPFNDPPIPDPPNKAKAKRYLKSLGVKSTYLDW